MKKEYEALYLEKSKQYNFKPVNLKTKKGQSEVMRYLLVNGFVPATPENIVLVGEEFYIEAKLLPSSLVGSVKEAVEKTDEWEEDEEFEEKEIEAQKPEVVGVWIRKGMVTSAKLEIRRKIEVTTVYSVNRLDVPTKMKQSP